MKRALAALAFLALTAPMGWAQLRVKAEREYAPHRKIVLQAADVTSAKAQFLWDVDGEADTVEAGGTLYVWAAPGTYKVRLTAIDFDAKKVERATFSFTVTGKTTPPGPKPDGPPDVKPDGGLKALRALVLVEEHEAAKLPAGQRAILWGKASHDKLNAVTPVGPDGKTREWRIWDQDVDAAGDDAKWAAAAKRARAAKGYAPPWVLLFDGEADAYSGPLPKDAAAWSALLDKHAPRAKGKGVAR